MIRYPRAALTVLLVALIVATPLAYAASNGPVAQGGPALGSDTGVQVTVETDGQLASASPFTDPDSDGQAEGVDPYGTGVVRSESSGAIVPLSDGDLSGSQASVDNLDVSGTTVTLDPANKPAVIIGSDATSVSFTNDVDSGDQDTDITYSAPQGGSVTAGAEGLEPSQSYVIYDSGSGSQLAISSADSSGRLVATGLPGGDRSIYLRKGGSAPVIDGGTASPTGTGVTNTTLTIDVSDEDFSEPLGDVLTATWYADGGAIATTSASSNGTISFDWDGVTVGSHDWAVAVEDKYGNRVNSSTFSFTTVTTLEIADEIDGSSIDGNAEGISATAYTESDVYTVSTDSNGDLDLSGLPFNKVTRLVIEDTSDSTGSYDYRKRTVTLETLGEQRTVYLLRQSAGIQNLFTLNDVTGEYPTDNTTLVVKKAVPDGSGSPPFVVVTGDSFGAANEVGTYLEQGARYRLIIRNENTGQTRVLGDYTPSVSGTVELDVDRVRFPQPEGDGISYVVEEIEESGTQYVVFKYNDPEGKTTDLEVTIHERGNESNVLASYDLGSTNKVRIKEPVPPSEEGTEWVAKWNATRAGSESQSINPVGGDFGLNIPVGSQFLGMISIVLTGFVGALYQNRTATIGAIVMNLFMGVLMIFQLINMPPVLWWAASLIALVGHIRATGTVAEYS